MLLVYNGLRVDDTLSILHPIISYIKQNQRTYVDLATVDKDRRKYTEIIVQANAGSPRVPTLLNNVLLLV